VGLICVVAFFIQVLIHWVKEFVARKTGKAESIEVNNNDANDEHDIAITKLEVDNSSSIA
jgi:hypothetical protein